ncbi:hypothetical protein DFJ77DRAFT_319717 [Powellomyces hirtus]|nr:hypothetical protein DFJ77DRAFT_319717 [Powellomyces hirtus]
MFQAKEHRREDIECTPLLEKLSSVYIQRTLKELTVNDIAKLPPHHVSMLNSMRHTLNEARNNRLPHLTQPPTGRETEVEIVALAAYVRGHCEDGKMVTAVGSRLTSILRQEQEPLAVLFENNMLQDFYSKSISTAESPHQKDCRLVCTQVPRCKRIRDWCGYGWNYSTCAGDAGRRSRTSSSVFPFHIHGCEQWIL